jgi:hypothetical protein
MACPYFEPLRPRSRAPGAGQTAMLPLGDAWSGACRAGPPDAEPPGEHDLHPACNLGYARGRCARFPHRDGPDAVRFSVSADDGGLIRLRYALESDHHPFAHGRLEYSREHGSFAAAPETPVLLRQAAAYVESYLRRKQEADAP